MNFSFRLAALAAAALPVISSVHATTFDFRSSAFGGNVGDSFNGESIAVDYVDSVGILGIALGEPNPKFNFNAGSASLGIGVKSSSDLRPTQLEVGEGFGFLFSTPVLVNSITLQVFFNSASDGLGGPVSFSEDAIEIGLGDELVNFASPYDFTTGSPTEYTINLADLGFTDLFLGWDEFLSLIPTAGDGVRLQSIDVTAVPETGSILGALALTAAAVLARRRSSRA